MTSAPQRAPQLSTARGAALYIGALLGPSLLLLPGLAAELAGPASILAWLGLLAVSGLLAVLFTALGTRLPSGGGVAGYAAAGLGAAAGRAVGWCFLVAVVCGAPVVCLIGGGYVGVLLGGGRTVGVAAGAVLLAVVIGLTFGGARATMAAQLVLVAVLVGLVAVAVVGSAHAARFANWTPFLPHGWSSLGSAASVLMLSFVGWEAIAPLTARLREPARQLPRIMTVAFLVTTLVYLGLAAATIAVLGASAGTAVPLADLLRVAVGSAGPVVAAVAAVALTLATTNAYLTGAAALAANLRAEARAAEARAAGIRASGSSGGRPATTSGRGLQLGIAGTGVLLLAGAATGLVSTTQLVALPTTLFLTVYLGCTVSAARLFTGRLRLVAVLSAAAVAVILAFAGWTLLAALLVCVLAVTRRNPVSGNGRSSDHCHSQGADAAGVALGELVDDELGGLRTGGGAPVAVLLDRVADVPQVRDRRLAGQVEAGDRALRRPVVAHHGDREHPGVGEPRHLVPQVLHDQLGLGVGVEVTDRGFGHPGAGVQVPAGRGHLRAGRGEVGDVAEPAGLAEAGQTGCLQ
jgi:amino acid efflux transporter